ncbi:MAG: VOC family protein [Betaproteobacteria bacterium]|nr:VOC family protein [Betaproteobacteria bacterium]MCC6246238.1 VOC family protein [Rubrivivax sp.]MCL4699225.1 VOC family protein [Burkholderiaceae bacterium]
MKSFEDVFKTPGAFSWTELMTPDAKKATEFYGSLFGWKFDVMNMGGGGDYHVVKTDDTAIGGIMAIPPGQPMPTAWCAYVTVPDTDAAAVKCKALGGSVCAGPMDIPNVGRFAVLQDPQGAVFNVIAYAMPAN